MGGIENLQETLQTELVIKTRTKHHTPKQKKTKLT